MKSLSSIDSYISCATDFQENTRFSQGPTIDLGPQETSLFSHSPVIALSSQASATTGQHTSGERVPMLTPVSVTKTSFSENAKKLFFSGNSSKGLISKGGCRSDGDSGPSPLSDSSALSDSLLSPELSVYTTASSRTPPKSPEIVAHQKEAGMLLNFVSSSSFSAKNTKLEKIMMPMARKRISRPSSL